MVAGKFGGGITAAAAAAAQCKFTWWGKVARQPLPPRPVVLPAAALQPQFWLLHWREPIGGLHSQSYQVFL